MIITAEEYKSLYTKVKESELPKNIKNLLTVIMDFIEENSVYKNSVFKMNPILIDSVLNDFNVELKPFITLYDYVYEKINQYLTIDLPERDTHIFHVTMIDIFSMTKEIEGTEYFQLIKFAAITLIREVSNYSSDEVIDLIESKYPGLLDTLNNDILSALQMKIVIRQSELDLVQ